MLRLLGIIIIIALVMLGLSFAVLNAEEVQLNYYLGTVAIPLSMALVSTLALGVLLGVLVSISLVVGLKRRNVQLQRKVDMAEREVSNLRAIPIKDAR